ncbi:hypothetical protein ACOTVM_01635 [Aliarcobacter butzleri]
MNNANYVNNLPTINYTNQYLVLERYSNSFHEFYEKTIMEHMLTISKMSYLKIKNSKKATEILQKGEWEKLEYYPKIREALIIENTNHFKKFNCWLDYFEYIDNPNSFELYIKTPSKRRAHQGPSPYSLIAEFLVSMVSKGIIMLPFYHVGLSYTKSQNIKAIINKYYSNDERYITLVASLDYHYKKSLNKQFIINLIIFSTNLKKEEFTDTNLEKIKEIYDDNHLILAKSIKNRKDTARKSDIHSYTNILLNKLPSIFIKLGSNVNTNLQRIMKNKTIDDKLEVLKDLNNDKKFLKNKNLINYAIEHFRQLYYVDRLSLTSMPQKISILKDFLELLINHYQYKKVTKQMINEYLDYPKNNTTYQHYLKEKEKNGINATLLIRSQGIVIDFLNSTDEFYGCYKENCRIRFRDTGASLFRESLDEEVYEKIVDILISRPPEMESIKKWGTEKADWSKWWDHSVIPFLPIALLLHLHLPLRSAHILNLDRDNFLIKDNDGSIRGFYINTDKNTSKKEGHIIPNIYKNSLDIINNLIELNKKMYPNLQKIKYKNDENSPWEEFYPLFPNFDGDNVMTKSIYEKYFKIVVLTAQFELYKEGKNIKIAWFKDTDAFPYSLNAIQQIKSDDITSNLKLSFGLHSLRVTGATKLLRMGLPPQLIILFTGHKNISTLIKIYLKIPHDELARNFFKIRDSIDTSTIESLSRNHKHIPETILSFVDSENPDEILAELKMNNIFTLPRINTDVKKTTNTRTQISDGLERMCRIHWTHWNSYSFGICGQPDSCPVGAEGKCSLCPFLATGPLFLHGIISKIEQIQKRVFVQSNMIAQNRKQNKHSENKTLHKQQVIDIEELTGWYEILTKVEDIINSENMANKSNNEIVTQSRTKLICFETISEEEGLLRIYENAKKLHIYNPDIQDSIFRLSTKIIRWCMECDKIEEIKTFIDDPEKIVDWFIPHKKLDRMNFYQLK